VATQTPLTVVIPTYNRGDKLRATLDAVLASATEGLEPVEVIVVDDGSDPPAADALAGLEPQAPFSLNVVRQDNAGVGAARNRGFREAAGDLVLFVDDDVLLESDALAGHVDAHRRRPGTVVFGDYPYVPGPDTPFRRWAERTGLDKGAPTTEALAPSDIVASGHISVEPAMFAESGRVYDDALATPVSEEWELKLRLDQRGIPVLRATYVRGHHDREVTLAAVCTNQYGHGLGSGEAARTRPETLGIPALRHIVETHAPDALGMRPTVKAAAWRVLSQRRARRALLSLADHVHAALLYRLAVGAHFSAGVRDGLVTRPDRSSSYSAS
jgi:hypothetical protein